MKKFLWMLLVFAACGELQEATYRSAEEAREAGAFERGWLPAQLPYSTEFIREAHHIDTNVGWIAVEYDRSEYADLGELYRGSGWEFIPYDASRLSVRFPDPPVEWWPLELRPATAATPHTDVYTRSVDGSHRWWVFVLPTEKHLFIWHGPEAVAGPLHR